MPHFKPGDRVTPSPCGQLEANPQFRGLIGEVCDTFPEDQTWVWVVFPGHGRSLWRAKELQPWDTIRADRVRSSRY